MTVGYCCGEPCGSEKESGVESGRAVVETAWTLEAGAPNIWGGQTSAKEERRPAGLSRLT